MDAPASTAPLFPLPLSYMLLLPPPSSPTWSYKLYFWPSCQNPLSFFILLPFRPDLSDPCCPVPSRVLFLLFCLSGPVETFGTPRFNASRCRACPVCHSPPSLPTSWLGLSVGPVLRRHSRVRTGICCGCIVCVKVIPSLLSTYSWGPCVPGSFDPEFLQRLATSYGGLCGSLLCSSFCSVRYLFFSHISPGC